MKDRDLIMDRAFGRLSSQKESVTRVDDDFLRRESLEDWDLWSGRKPAAVRAQQSVPLRWEPALSRRALATQPPR